jgi:hypothetical protein
MAVEMPNRPVATRWIAGLLALGGTVFAVLTLPVLFSPACVLPGWLAYFALLVTATSGRLAGGPWTTWGSTLTTAAAWIFVIYRDFDFARPQTFAYYFLRLHVLAIPLTAVVAIVIERDR